MFGFWTRAPQARRILIFASANHIWSDLFFSLYAPLLPLIKEDLGLTFTEAALLRSVFAGASAVLQAPAGLLAERIGEFWLLVGGNLWVASGIVGMSLAPSYAVLLALTLVAGLGGGAQHPLASSMVSRAYEAKGRSTAVGTVNFAGDLGKMAAPALALIVAVAFGWRATLLVVGVAATVFLLASIFLRRSVEMPKPVQSDSRPTGDGGGQSQTAGFVTLSVIGLLDSAARGAALTFIPFVLSDRGYGEAGIFAMLFVLLTGGATGKFVCGWLADRIGAVSLIWLTKGATAVLLALALVAPIPAMVPLMFLLGVGLNGTSSVLYATVPSFVPPHRRARMFGYFYTTNEVGAVVAPLMYGVLADMFDLNAAMAVMGVVTAMILPASLSLRKHLRQTRS